MGLLNPHLEEDDFADVWSTRAALSVAESDRPAEDHLRTCADCRARYGAFAEWLQGLRADAHAEADALLGRERLAVQQTQILRRLESLEHPARVITFPKFAGPVAAQSSGRRRWIAAAAAVGLITGVGLGRMVDVPTRRDSIVLQRPISRAAAPVADTRAAVLPVAQLSDETFLEPEGTSSQVRVPESLQYLNAVTPSARDYDPR